MGGVKYSIHHADYVFGFFRHAGVRYEAAYQGGDMYITKWIAQRMRITSRSWVD